MTTVLFTNPNAPQVKWVKIGNGKTHHLTRVFEGIANELTLCGKGWTAPETRQDSTRCKSCAKVWDRLTTEFWADAPDAGSRNPQVETGDNPPVGEIPLVDQFVIFNDTEFKIIDRSPDQSTGGGPETDWLALQALDGYGQVSIQVRDIERDNLTVTPAPTRPIPTRACDLNALMPTGHVIEVGEFRNVSDAPNVYAPNVYVDTDVAGQISSEHESDMILALSRQGWSVETGWTGQYSYNGPIMHPSEFIGGPLADHILNTPGFWVACEVTTLDTEEWAGWVLLHRETAPSNPAPAVIPAQRKPFTPADLDALNLRRHVGSQVRLFGGPRRFARLASVLPRVGDNPPAVMVEFPNGHTARYSLGNVLLSS